MAVFRDAKGKVKDDKAFKAALAQFGDRSGIRHIRVAKEDMSVVTIADRLVAALAERGAQ